jgi:hypothetical protein
MEQIIRYAVILTLILMVTAGAGKMNNPVSPRVNVILKAGVLQPPRQPVAGAQQPPPQQAAAEHPAAVRVL